MLPTPEEIIEQSDDPYRWQLFWLLIRDGLHGDLSRDLRKGLCSDPKSAFLLAVHGDQEPRDDTREGACKDPQWAYHYAIRVDQGPRDDTRKAASKHHVSAFAYAELVDQEPHPDTWEGVQDNLVQRTLYIRHVGEPVRVDCPECHSHGYDREPGPSCESFYVDCKRCGGKGYFYDAELQK